MNPFDQLNQLQDILRNKIRMIEIIETQIDYMCQLRKITLFPSSDDYINVSRLEDLAYYNHINEKHLDKLVYLHHMLDNEIVCLRRNFFEYFEKRYGVDLFVRDI